MKLAQYDPTARAPQPVVGWYDTDSFEYPNLPTVGMLELSDEQWQARLSTPFVSNGTLVAPPAPPPPSLAQQARAMLAAGIQITSSATPSLNSTYSCDQATNNEDGNLLSAFNAGLSFPGGVIVRLDVTGVPHAFSPSDFKNLCQAKLSFQQTLNTIMGSNSGTLPTLPIAIP